MSNNPGRMPWLFPVFCALIVLLSTVGTFVHFTQDGPQEHARELSPEDVREALAYAFGAIDAEVRSLPVDTVDMDVLHGSLEHDIEREFAMMFGERSDGKMPEWLVSKVAQYVDTFSSRRDLIEQWDQNGRKYAPMILDALESEGLPDRLLYLAMLESSLRPDAVSPAGATGIWQFMPATAREMGLRVSAEFDERRDPVASTRAAARYLSYLYDQMGDWALAAAAYNGGMGRVRRALERTGAKTYWDLVEQNALPDETMAYVPKIMAISILAGEGRHDRRVPHNNMPYDFAMME